MSTHGTIGRINGQAFTGRYVHSDGYPSNVGWHFAQIIRRDGVDATLAWLKATKRDWETLEHRLPELTDEIRAEIGDMLNGPFTDNPARWYAYIEAGSMNYVKPVPSYGLADKNGTASIVRMTLDAPNPDEWDTEWSYGIDKAANELVIGHTVTALQTHKIAARLPLDDLPTERDAWSTLNDLCKKLCGGGEG